MFKFSKTQCSEIMDLVNKNSNDLDNFSKIFNRLIEKYIREQEDLIHEQGLKQFRLNNPDL